MALPGKAGEWLGKAASGVAGILGGPLKWLITLIVEQGLSRASDWLRAYLEEREKKKAERAKRDVIVVAYKTALLAATTPAEKEKAFDDYQKALAAIGNP